MKYIFFLPSLGLSTINKLIMIVSVKLLWVTYRGIKRCEYVEVEAVFTDGFRAEVLREWKVTLL